MIAKNVKYGIKHIIILYLIIILLKITLSSFIMAPSAFSDYYGHAKIARSCFYEGNLAVHEIIGNRPVLYSIMLSPAYIFKDMELTYFFMKFLNALMSSLIIFPAWFLSREFFNRKKSMFLTAMISVLPAHFSFTFFLMAENLFYPLFLFSIYFIYKSYTEKNYKWDILAGIFIGLSYLTKINGLILPIVVFFVFLFKIYQKDYMEIGKKSIMAFFFFLTASPWLIRNGLIFGFNKNALLGSYSKTLEGVTSSLGGNFLLIFSTWFILFLGYLIIASGFIFFISSFLTFYRFKDKKIFIFSLLTLFSILLMICLASRTFAIGVIKNQTIFPWLAGRPIGRYVEAVIPLILINGLFGLKYLKKISKIYIIPIIILIFSSQLVFFPLFPINNMSLTWLGVLKFGFDFLIYKKVAFETIFSYWYSILFAIIIASVFLFTFYLQKKLSIKKLLCIFIIFFFSVSLLNFAVIYYNSYTYWYKSEQTQMGLWFNKYDPEISTVLFDERDGCKIFKTNQTCIYNPFRSGGSATIIGFWMNDKIRIGQVDNLEGIDYVVSRHKLDLHLIKKTENGIFLYKTN